jgi:hypothetical protein
MCTSDPTSRRFPPARFRRPWPGSFLDVGVDTTGLFGHEALRCWYGPSIPFSWQISVDRVEVFGGPRGDLEAAYRSFGA